MGFEKTVLNEIARVEPEVEAYFYSGTLFYESTENQSRKIFSTLFQFQNGRVQINKVGNEYAIDFVAEKQQPKTEDFSPFATVNS